MSLQEFIKKNKEEFATELRCGSCGNSLQQCGKYTIEKVGMGQGKRSEEGILCETCNNANRKLVRVTRIIESPQTAIKQVAQFLITDLNPKTQQEERMNLEQFKKIEAETLTKEQTKVFDEKTKFQQQQNKDTKEKDKKD